MKILLAEDDLRLGKLTNYMLEQNKISVEWITDGGEVEEYARYTDYDVLVLDWVMPNVTGVDACRSLRQNGYEKAILMLTARDSVEDRVTGLDAGADDYLVKPLQNGLLRLYQLPVIVESRVLLPRGNAGSVTNECIDRDGHFFDLRFEI